ncbi:MAG: P-loop NTPase [Candidatus Njordarchaeales archaeon]
MIDPRISVIEKRFSEIKRIISVVSGKGGVGKTVIASTLALSLAKNNYRTGLFDLDFYGPGCHIVLGVGKVFLEEEKGIIPPKFHGVSLMSIEFFAKDEPVAMRGTEVTDALIELMAITRWGPLDFLIIDLPPGLGEEVLDVIRLLRNTEFLVVTTPSKLSMMVAEKLLKLLKRVRANILGLVENMALTHNMGSTKPLAEKYQVEFLGSIRLDEKLEAAIGVPEKIFETIFFKDIQKIFEKLCKGINTDR